LKQAYVSELINVIALANQEFGILLAEEETRSMEEILLGTDITTTEDYENYVEAQLEETGAQLSSFEMTVMIPRDQIEAPQITIEESIYPEMPPVDRSVVEYEIDGIIHTAQAGRTARNTEYGSLVEEYRNNVSDLQTKVTEITTAYADESELQEQLNGGLSGFQLSTYMPEDEVGKYTQELQNNNEAIVQKINENNDKYETYTSKVYEATSSNIAALQKNVLSGQEASNKKLEDGLAAAKSSRENSNEENIAVLKDLGTRLSYSRLGELENKEVYDFIAEPLLLENQSQPGKMNQQTEGAVSATAKAVSGAAMSGLKTGKEELPLWLWISAGSGMAAVLLIFVTLHLKRRKKKEEF